MEDHLERKDWSARRRAVAIPGRTEAPLGPAPPFSARNTVAEENANRVQLRFALKPVPGS